MGFWDDFADTTKQVFDYTGNKADELVQKGKLKYRIEKLSYQLRQQQRKLGALVYGLKKAGKENAPLLEECMGQIDALVDQLREARSQYDSVGGSPAAALKMPTTPSTVSPAGRNCRRTRARRSPSPPRSKGERPEERRERTGREVPI